MSGDDRRGSYWLGAEERMKAALQLVPATRSPIPPEYWQLLAEAHVLAALASAPYDVAIPVAFHEHDAERDRRETQARMNDVLRRRTNGEQ